MFHSLLSYGKWWRARYFCAPACSAVRIIDSDILFLEHLPVVFHLLDHIKSRNFSDVVDKFTDWERLQSLACGIISRIIQTNSGKTPIKRPATFPFSIASSYRLPTSKITLSDLTKDAPGLESLLKHKRRLRKLWQVTREPECTTAINWVIKPIGRMTRRKAF
jgi:hypothetical protein